MSLRFPPTNVPTELKNPLPIASAESVPDTVTADTGVAETEVAETEVASHSSAPTLVIEPRRTGPVGAAREFWRYRHLLAYFGRRYVEKRYVRTWLGWLWIPLRPALDVGARVLLFGALLSVPSSGLPYLIFFVVGMSAWQLFERTVYWATRSLELNRRTLRRVYYPRLVALVAAVVPSGLDYLLYLVITAIAVVYYRFADGFFYVELSTRTLWALVGLGMLLVLALAIGLWTSVFAADARDVRFGLSYVMGIWFLMTPVIYPLNAIPDRFRTLAEINPLTAPIELVKFGLTGTGEVPVASLVTSVSMMAIGVGFGLWFFSRFELAALDRL